MLVMQLDIRLHNQLPCSNLFENLHYLRTKPSHSQDFYQLIVGNVRM